MGAARDVTPDLLADLGELERLTTALAARAAAEGMSLEFDRDEFGNPIPCLVRAIFAPRTEATEH